MQVINFAPLLIWSLGVLILDHYENPISKEDDYDNAEKWGGLFIYATGCLAYLILGIWLTVGSK